MNAMPSDVFVIDDDDNVDVVDDVDDIINVWWIAIAAVRNLAIFSLGYPLEFGTFLISEDPPPLILNFS